MKSIKLILLATIVLASFAVAQTTQNVVASNSNVENKQEHTKNCDDDGCEVENVHKHLNCDANDDGCCDDDGCEGNSGVTINNEEQHINENCNTHRADSANDSPDSDCKDKSHFKPANDD